MTFRNLMREANITVKEITYKFYINHNPKSTQQISRWACGRNLPRADTILKLSEYVEQPAGEVLKALVESNNKFKEKCAEKSNKGKSK
jgi:transcriptional regulator with XRE-family HTH domain